ncbi:MAG TPA: CDP-alcohol phosphatidyltransferase family protein [Acidimicrobiales bacterium]|nr:CDP-alcohol phosphatidyltransferase family protein [Acidimicrobiales bacterium]
MTPGNEDRLLTVPNGLSVGRLLLVPVFVWLVWGRHDDYIGAALLAGLGATDWVDGYIARRFDQVSSLGKVLDPTADRVLVAAAVVSALAVHAVPLWLCVVVGAREALVSVGVLALGALRVERIDVVWVGKAGTLGLMFALPLFLVAHSSASWHSIAHVLAWLFCLPAIVLGWMAAISYARSARQALNRRHALEPRVRSVP